MSNATAKRRSILAPSVVGELPVRLIDQEGERLVLSNMLERPEFCKIVLPQLVMDHFALDIHQRVFQAIRDAVENGYEHGLAGVFRCLLDRGKTPEELGLPLLSNFAYENTIELINPDPWIRALQTKAVERKTWRAAETLRLGMELGTNPGEVMASAREELRKLEAAYALPAQRYVTIADMLERMEGGPGALFTADCDAIPTPFDLLTRVTNGGPRPGQFWIVAARPSLGKTTVGLQFATHAAATGNPVLFISLEMSEVELLRRIISAYGKFDHSTLIRAGLGPRERRLVVETLDRIGSFTLTMTDRVRTLAAVCAEIASGSTGRPWSLVVVDYLGLVEVGGRFENRNAEVSMISRRLKLAAIDGKVPIIALHQLNRGPETQDRRPQLSDLRDSGTLEQDADTVLLLDSPALRKKGDAPKDATDLIIAKQRNGARGLVLHLKFEPQFCRMVEGASGD